jgi:hypothetical protein
MRELKLFKKFSRKFLEKQDTQWLKIKQTELDGARYNWYEILNILDNRQRDTDSAGKVGWRVFWVC